jgi:calcium binding protein 39
LALKDGLFGPRDGSSEPAISDVSQLCSGIYSQDLLISMINNLSRVTFEDRKEIVAIFNNLLRRQVGSKFPAVDHIIQKSAILFKLIDG